MIIIQSRPYALMVALACLLALGGALVAQFGFGLHPCVLCLYQRGPYALAAVLAFLALRPAVSPRGQGLLLALCALAFIINSGIASYHVGVEQHWWHGTASCTPTAPVPATAEEMMASLSAPPPARCDEVSWALFGISMAGFNVPASLVLAAFSGWAARKVTERK